MTPLLTYLARRLKQPDTKIEQPEISEPDAEDETSVEEDEITPEELLAYLKDKKLDPEMEKVCMDVSLNLAASETENHDNM